jgi:hypothetical protein
MATTHTMQAPLQTGASWHDPLQDQPLRAQLTQNMWVFLSLLPMMVLPWFTLLFLVCWHRVQIFAKKKGQNLQQGWSSKIADFVRRLENELYSRARSRVRVCHTEFIPSLAP